RADALLTSRVPALAFALHLSVAEEPRHHSVQVVRFDPHLLSDLRDRDARGSAHEFERLVGTSTATAAPTRATRTAAATTARCCACRRCGCTRGTWTTRSTPATDECGARRLELGDLLLQLAEAVIDFLHGAVYEASQIDHPSSGVQRYGATTRYM